MQGVACGPPPGCAAFDLFYDEDLRFEIFERLNREYEQRFGFPFVVFVNRRPKSEIVPVLRERLERAREMELDTALHELVAIARDRWERG